MTEPNTPISFAAFYLIWAEVQGWEVSENHIGVCHWLEHRAGRVGVLKVFRGFGKSSILGCYNAWRYYRDPTDRILHQGDQDKTAHKTARDTQNVLTKHPLTRNIGASLRGNVEFWWTADGYWKDPRNPSMQSSGVMSNIVSSRADHIQNDDVEVQKNVETPEAREKMRKRLSEQIHIGVPGSDRLFIGTPHAHNSIYDEMEEMGADVLSIPLFAQEQRFSKDSKQDSTSTKTTFHCQFVPEVVFLGIGKQARLLMEAKVNKAGKVVKDGDYVRKGKTLKFKAPPKGTLDFYAGNAWPARFTTEEMAERRRQCRTLNEWDSQYQLHAKPITDVRLDPEQIIPYDIMPVIKVANRKQVMMLGGVKIVGATAYWDCATGKITSDASPFSVVLTDDLGRLYLKVNDDLPGNLDDQCRLIRKYVIKYQLPRVEVETNGPGGFVPPILRKHLKGTGCGVGEVHQSTNKNKRILDGWEAPIDGEFLWAHVDVLNGPLWDQMLEWNPAVKEQPDDYLDSGAGAISATPVRIGKVIGNPSEPRTQNWRPSHNQFEVTVER